MLKKGNWRKEQKHPAVLAYLEKFAPNPREYPESVEDWPALQESIENGLPSGVNYDVFIEDGPTDYESINGIRLTASWHRVGTPGRWIHQFGSIGVTNQYFVLHTDPQKRAPDAYIVSRPIQDGRGSSDSL